MQNTSSIYSLTARLSETEFGKDKKVFGVLNLQIKNQEEGEHLPKPQHFILTVDRSGSMANREKDGMTKMQHVIHTISNMMRYFAYELADSEIYVSVITFDNKIDCIIDKLRISKDNIKELVAIVEEIYPRDMTDIGAAILAANKQKTTFPHPIEQTHILLTDGIPTCGVTNQTELKSIINTTYRNILIGYGVDHHMKLMQELAHNDLSSYYFVESAENAGNVYGEILHNILHEMVSNAIIKTDDAEIYDWKNNEWTKTLNVGSLSCGVEKVYHIRVIPNQYDIENILCITMLYTLNGIEHNELVPAVTKEPESLFEMTKYIYRQKTLELLFAAANNTLVPSRLKKDITALMDLISSEMETEQQLKDQTCKDYLFMQNLRDDLYVAEKSISSRYGSLYLGARMISQGDQRAYNVKNLDAMGSVFSGFSKDLDDMDGPLPPLGTIDRTCASENYKMSSEEASPYACANQRYLMRQCSQEPLFAPDGE